MRVGDWAWQRSTGRESSSKGSPSCCCCAIAAAGCYQKWSYDSLNAIEECRRCCPASPLCVQMIHLSATHMHSLQELGIPITHARMSEGWFVMH
jgi:hypothetical protein